MVQQDVFVQLPPGQQMRSMDGKGGQINHPAQRGRLLKPNQKFTQRKTVVLTGRIGVSRLLRSG